MLKYILLFFAVFLTSSLKAQNTFEATIRNAETKEVLNGSTAYIGKLKKGAGADSTGKVIIENIPAGKFKIMFSYVGFEEREQEFLFPLSNADQVFDISLEPQDTSLDDVIVSSTRSSRSIRNTPSRIEIIEKEEVNEEGEMRPGDIRMLLSESTGIQAQQTSAVSGNAAIRIQGLDGRYTQILKDGFPVYAGAANGLGILQTPPLDLRQVEIIKGSSSTLYGGGAIAGLINLLTKVPADKRELNVHLNGTSAGGLDINSFYGQRFKKAGVTVFVSRNTNNAFAPGSTVFTAIPKFERYTINPKLFLYFSDKTKLNFGVNATFENRLGGDVKFIQGNGDSTHSYFERNKTKRISTQFIIEHQLTEGSSLTFKNSISYFNRVITSPGYGFNGTQYSTFTEANYISKKKGTDWVAGINILTDRFSELPLTAVASRNYDQNTLGLFIQNTWNAADWLIIETGLRGDYVNDYGFELLPRISTLFKITPRLTSRIGGGLGYKPPNIFTEETEKLFYRNVLPVNPDTNKLEKSYGANWDASFKTSFNEITFSINQLFFYTYLKNPLFLEPVQNGLYRLHNISGHIITKGAETNIKLGYDDISLYLGYTFIDATIHDNGSTSQNPLTPKHRFNSALVYEIENKWRLGSELYYFSKQTLTDGSTGRDYWLTGLLAERIWKKWSLYINFENLGDVRQTKFGNIDTGRITNPVFKDIYAPLDGFTANAGVKLKL